MPCSSSTIRMRLTRVFLERRRTGTASHPMTIASCRGKLGGGKGHATHPRREQSLWSSLVEGHAAIGDAHVAQITRDDDRQPILRKSVGTRAAFGLPEDTRNH